MRGPLTLTAAAFADAMKSAPRAWGASLDVRRYFVAAWSNARFWAFA